MHFLEKSTPLMKLIRLTILLIPVLLLLSTGVNADTQSKQKQIKKEIRQLNSSLKSDKNKSASLQSEVRKLEKKLGETSRKQYSTETKIKAINLRLMEATKEREQLDKKLTSQKKALAQQMQALHTAGEQSHLRLLLKQDDPSDIGRTVKYFEYLNRSRLKKIRSINATLTKIRGTELEIQKDKQELQALNAELEGREKKIKKILASRTAAYKKARKKVSSKQQRLKKLKKKEARLQATIDRLIKKAKAREREAEEKAARKKQAKATARANQKKSSKAGKKSSNKKGPVVGSQKRYVPDRPFSSLRGKLSWPVKGRLIHSYGSRRNEKQRWKGTVISAPGGRKVRAIARGKVEFAGWFNGYGYLVIIRHDNNYRSLYGYNRTVYTKKGKIVKAGTVIAAVGNSGGQQQNALYFEIRRGTRHQNPAKWCR
jgi:septal ring factor EnvC (AmiA/AmiB activator)